MTKLFVGVILPDDVRTKLHAIQPPVSQGVRPTNPDQLHLTLHFIGLADPEPIEQSLSTVISPPFSLSIAGVGHFQSSDGGVILFAEVDPSEGLRSLHEHIGAALSSTGLQIETRPYTPHITLARCHRVRTPGLLGNFLSQHENFSLPAFAVKNFVLYSSESGTRGPVYTGLRTFRLVELNTNTTPPSRHGTP
ncbi:RNA 2',3'-cyclic phosphodiesterase [Schlesneria paludicola]|uniref:RNA 2',3'-cyclic phosphodiesterase n=1 Tax=Schlesneria paludicola TaxID=360056 RepID=UPI0002E95618|nr:RNA 2',3'-cyclic phosphodiesterase [Schlesneria paludicola]